MHKPFEPRFPECRECKFYRPSRPSANCLRCGAGEFFEEKEPDGEPDADELMRMYAEMDNDSGD